MLKNICPECGRERFIREGVNLTPILSLIYDKIKLSGDDGILISDLRIYVSNRTGRKTGDQAVVMSVKRINDFFEANGTKIRIKSYRYAAIVNWRIGAKKQGGRLWNYFYYVEKI